VHPVVPAFCFKGLTIASLGSPGLRRPSGTRRASAIAVPAAAPDIKRRPPTVDPVKPLLPGHRERDFLVREVEAGSRSGLAVRGRRLSFDSPLYIAGLAAADRRGEAPHRQYAPRGEALPLIDEEVR
jgi:hypothetical protein